MISGDGSYTGERERRIVAMRKGYYQIGRVWMEEVPLKLQRSLFIAKVQNAGLSAIEAFVPAEGDYLKLDRALAALGRKAMAGAAHQEEEGRHSCLGTYEVIKFWQLASTATEARVRRLRWYQTVAGEPSNNMQLLAAWLGTVKAEREDEALHCCSERGELLPGANPWARQMEEDFKSLEALESAQGLLEELEGCIARVFMWQRAGQSFSAPRCQ